MNNCKFPFARPCGSPALRKTISPTVLTLENYIKRPPPRTALDSGTDARIGDIGEFFIDKPVEKVKKSKESKKSKKKKKKGKDILILRIKILRVGFKKLGEESLAHRKIHHRVDKFF